MQKQAERYFVFNKFDKQINASGASMLSSKIAVKKDIPCTLNFKLMKWFIKKIKITQRNLRSLYDCYNKHMHLKRCVRHHDTDHPSRKQIRIYVLFLLLYETTKCTFWKKHSCGNVRETSNLMSSTLDSWDFSLDKLSFRFSLRSNKPNLWRAFFS